MKTRILISAIIAIVSFSCVKSNVVHPPEPDLNDYFDFTTIENIKLTIDYKIDYNTPILFYVYDQNPFITIENGAEILNLEIPPIFKGLTQNYGKFSGDISIKKAVKEIYIYSSTLGVPQLLKANINSVNISVSPTDPNNHVVYSTLVKSSNAFINNNAVQNYRLLGDWDNQGVPNYLKSPKVSIPASLINDINESLPESKPVPVHNPHYIANGVQSAIHIIENARVEIVFLHEGASFRNVLGYFHYPTNSPPTSVDQIDKIIAFPNASLPGSGGNLAVGSRVELKYWDGNSFQEIFPPGVSIGWFIIANGFRNETISPTQPHFYSLEQFNPEVNPALKPHNVLLYDPDRKIVIVGFEDINREQRSDNDFNDLVFYTTATPETAIQYTDLPLLKKSNDSDGDGIPDDRDEFPNDANIVLTRHYPAENTYYTIAYEDLWPNRGDYDMNDVVIGYNSTHFINNQNQVIKTIDRFEPIWSGGVLDVGFGYQLGVASSRVAGVNITSPYPISTRYNVAANGTENGQSKATIMVVDDYTKLNLRNKIENGRYNIEVVFTTPVSITELTTPPYNPFIVVNVRRGMEVHLPNHPPTDLADKSILGKYNDKSNPLIGRYYVSDDNMPFAILIPGVFRIPPESVSIKDFYPRFLPWSKSFGQEDADWYLFPRE